MFHLGNNSILFVMVLSTRLANQTPIHGNTTGEKHKLFYKLLYGRYRCITPQVDFCYVVKRKHQRGIKWYGAMLFCVNLFYVSVKKETKRRWLCQISGFCQRKFNGINRFFGINQEKNRQAFQSSCSCGHRSGCHVAFNCCEKQNGLPERALQPLKSSPPSELCWMHRITSHLSVPLHVAFELESIHFRDPERNKGGQLEAFV